MRGGLVSLALQHITDRCLETLFIANVSLTSTFRPPVFPARFVNCELTLLQLSRAPRLELIAHIFRISVSRHHDVHMIRPAIEGMQVPVSDPTMVGDRFLDEGALRRA